MSCCLSPWGCLQPWCFLSSLWTYFTPFSPSPSLNLSHSCSIASPRSPHHSPSIYVSLPLSLSLSTHFSFRRLRIPAAPLREVCENAQCRSPGVPTPGTECEKRALHLMPDWPNLLPDSWAFLFPAARQERGQKWCGRRGEGTVIVSRSVEIPHPPTYPPPLLNRSSTASQLKGKVSLGSKKQLLSRITKKQCALIYE